MSSTEVAYVPVETLGVYASFDDCSFVGDAELLTISKAEAYVRDCDFEFRVEEGLWGEGRIYHDTWMLSLERTVRDPLVERCTFKGEGNGTGLVVNHQRADLIELEFSGLRVGAWVHGVGPSMGWDVLEPSLSFDGTCSVKYMETVEVRVEFDGDDDPGYGYEGYRMQYSRSISGVPDVGGLSFPVISSANSSLCCLPLRIVSEENGSFEVEELTIRLRPPWGNWDDYTVDPREPWLLFWLEGEGGGSWDGAFYMYREVLDPGKDPGVLNVTYTIHNYLYDIGEIYVNTTVDGEQVDHFVLNNTEYGWWYYNTALLNCTLTIPPGIHEYNVTCGLVSTTWDLTTELESHEGAIYRVSDPSQTGDLEDWLVDNPRATVLVDPYIAIDGLEVVGTEPILALEIRFVAWEGSSVVFDRVELDPGSWGELVTVGGGSFEFGDISAELLVHTARNCTVTIGHMDSYYFGATYSGCNVTIADHWNCSILSIECRDGSRIETEGLVTNSLELTLSEADCYLRGCEFRGAVWSGTLISARENSTLCVDGCEFINGPLMVPLYDSHASISVTNCTFRGEGAYFSLGCHHTLMSYSHLSNITPISGDVSGNVFDGEGTSLVFLPLLRGCLLGENTWRDGARAYAFYDPEVEYDGFSYRKYGFITADSISFYRSIGSDWRTINLDFYHLVDVTEDPLSDEDPGLVPSVIRVVPHYYYGDPSGPVVGYQALPVAASTITLRNLEWPDPEDGVAEIQRTFDIDDNWWSR
jgi:hypothetical protein